MLLEQVRVDQAVVRREGRARDSVEPIDLRNAPMHLRRGQLLDRLAELALYRQMLYRSRPRLLIVEPEITFLPEADLVANVLEILDRCTAQRDIDGLPPGRADAAGVLLAGAEPSAQIDIDDERPQFTLGQRHRQRASDDSAAHD